MLVYPKMFKKRAMVTTTVVLLICCFVCCVLVALAMGDDNGEEVIVRRKKRFVSFHTGEDGNIEVSLSLRPFSFLLGSFFLRILFIFDVGRIGIWGTAARHTREEVVGLCKRIDG